MNQLLVLLAAVCLGVSVFSALVGQDVRKLQTEFQQRQVEINENVIYKQLNERMIEALANVAASTGDEAIREMLSSEGVTFTVNQPPETTSTEQEGGENNE